MPAAFFATRFSCHMLEHAINPKRAIKTNAVRSIATVVAVSAALATNHSLRSAGCRGGKRSASEQRQQAGGEQPDRCR